MQRLTVMFFNQCLSGVRSGLGLAKSADLRGNRGLSTRYLPATCYEPKWGRLRYMNCAILRSTKHGYLQEGDQEVLALDHLGLTKGAKVQITLGVIVQDQGDQGEQHLGHLERYGHLRVYRFRTRRPYSSCSTHQLSLLIALAIRLTCYPINH